MGCTEKDNVTPKSCLAWFEEHFLHGTLSSKSAIMYFRDLNQVKQHGTRVMKSMVFYCLLARFLV
jgi:hypothetical protein